MSSDTPGETPGGTSGDTLRHAHSEPVTPEQLMAFTDALRGGAPDAPEALQRVWSGLCLARLLGLRLALVDAKWRQRQVNAESVEHQLAGDLRTTATFAGVALALPRVDSAQPLAPDEVEQAVRALVEFSGTARQRMLAVAPTAAQWHDERVLRHDSLVIGQLAAAWLGWHGSYRVEVH